MARVKKLLLAAGAAGGIAAGVLAHERLRVGGTGAALFWPAPQSVGIVINSDGSLDIPDGSHETALRLAIQDWNEIPGSTLTLVENTDPAQQARTDWEADSIHLIWFDETNDSGFFGGGSGIVAITPVWYFLNGQIVDADVLFNGAEFAFTTSGDPGAFDVGDVGAHEIGHLLGLDHSGWAGATMYPYVDPSTILHRSMSLDEIAGAREIAPVAALGRITGTIERLSDGSPVSGAHVVALDAGGRNAASALTNAAGAFTIFGLDAGTYTVYADPLDSPVSSGNLSPGHVIEADFETTFYGAQASVPAGGVSPMGVLAVGADVALSLGSPLDVYPLRAVKGTAVAHVVRGSGLVPGSTLAVSDPALSLGSVIWFGNSVSFLLTVPAGAVPGHADLSVTNPGGDLNVLPAAIEITPPNPAVANIAPSFGPKAGGTAVTITGSDFEPGARVVIGSQIYRDGVAGGCTVVDESTITLSTLPTEPGVFDVVVIDSTGAEGRLAGGYQAMSMPVIQTVFPPAGDAAGGTDIVLRGADFAPGLTVRIDGIVQPSATYDDPTRVLVTTLGGLPGGPYTLEVENPGGAIATSAFVYVAQPDPVVSGATPGQGATAGGTLITLSGTDLPDDAEVLFGADPDTGEGGTAAAGVVFVDASTLEIETPAHAKGTVSILVRDASTGQATVMQSAFSFTKKSSSGGGCFLRPVEPGAPPAGMRDVLLGGWWILALFAAALWMRRRGARAGLV